MKITRFFLAITLLAGICGTVYAQSLYSEDHYNNYTSHNGYDTNELADLKAQVKELSDGLKKKQDKPDTSKGFTAKLGGRVFMDSVNFTDPHNTWGTAPHQSNILGLREARIGVSGEGYGFLDYKVEIGYEYGPNGNDSVRLKDVTMGAQNIPWLDYVRIGHYKVESGMSYTASSRNTTAMERTTAVQVFSPGRRFGVGQTYYFSDERVRWFNGLFAARRMDADKYSVDDNQGVIFNSRLTMVPMYCDDGEQYLHLGGHYLFYQNPNGRNTRFTSPGSAKIGGFGRADNWYYVAAVNATGYHQGGLEMALGCGSLGFSSELFAGTFGHDQSMYGGYVEARWFLTGDCRVYDKKLGVPGNVKTRKNLNCVRQSYGNVDTSCANSLGAFELYTQLGFTDADRVYFHDVLRCLGGRTTDLTIGLNWYWNPNTRMMFEYVHSNGTRQGAYRASENIYSASFRYFF